MEISYKNFKISIRISIITLFVLLLGSIGSLIISINHVTLNKILLDSAKNFIQEVSAHIENRLHAYLSPLKHDLLETASLLTNKVISPANRESFNFYLFELANHNQNIYGIYFATPEGNFYGIDREANNKLALQRIEHSPSPASMRYPLNPSGHIKTSIPLKNVSYDPRTRPWYQAAVAAQRAIWTDIYSFHLFNAKQPLSLPGITAAIPIYGYQHKLLGVLGIDLTIKQLIKFMHSLNVSKHTIIYITNQFEHLVAFRGHKNADAFIGKKWTLAVMQQLNIPTIESILTDSVTTATSITIANKTYFVLRVPIRHSPDNIWHITMIVPIADILGPLRGVSIISLLLTVLSLIIGIVMVRYISLRISQPIIQLADEAKAITKLNLEQPPPRSSIIKEISYMNDTFDTMRMSLRSFQRYVPSSLVKNLVSYGKIAAIGGESKELSFLFSDIKDFTQLAEHIAPEALMHILSEYFETMTQAVIQSQGTLDKYIGDAIMAFWNAPLPVADHAVQACHTAVAMLNRLTLLNQQLRSQALPELDIRIGINTGIAVVGNVGSQERLSFTAIGDNVNLSSRLEALNKVYGTHILISQTTYDWVKPYFTLRMIDHVTVRGKQQGVIIYELLTPSSAAIISAHQPTFLTAFKHYQQGEWAQSLTLFEQLAPVASYAQLAQVFIKRCLWLRENQPTQWDGVWLYT